MFKNLQQTKQTSSTPTNNPDATPLCIKLPHKNSHKILPLTTWRRFVATSSLFLSVDLITSFSFSNSSFSDATITSSNRAILEVLSPFDDVIDSKLSAWLVISLKNKMTTKLHHFNHFDGKQFRVVCRLVFRLVIPKSGVGFYFSFTFYKISQVMIFYSKRSVDLNTEKFVD